MKSARRPHAIHTVRERLIEASERAGALAQEADEVARLITLSIEGGGIHACEAEALARVCAVAAALKDVSLRAACQRLEPGHSVRRRVANDSQPALLEAAVRPKRAAARGR